MQSIKTLVDKKEYSALQELFDIYKKINEWSVKNNVVSPCESDINNIFTNFRKELHQKLPIYLRMVNTVEF